MTKLVFAALFCVSVLSAKTIEGKDGLFRVSFPEKPGWGDAKESHPGPESVQWVAKHEFVRKIFLFSVVDSPVPNPDAPLSEHVKEWRKSVAESADSIDSERYSELGGVETFEITGRITNAGSPYYFLRYLMQQGQVTYQVTVISGAAIVMSDREIQAFLGSIHIKKKPRTSA